MKSSIIALTAAFALTLGATGFAMAQAATDAPQTLEECLVQEGTGDTAPESLATETGSDDGEGGTGPAAEGLAPALGQAVACPNSDGADDDASN